MPFEPKVHMQAELFDADLPDDLTALAAQLSDDAQRVSAQYPCGPVASAGFGKELEAIIHQAHGGQRRFMQKPWFASHWSLARAAAVLALATGTTLGALWQVLGPDAGNDAGNVANRQRVNRQRIEPAVSNGLATLADEGAGATPASSERVVVPIFVSAGAADGLSGEEIEVLADAFAGQVVEI